MKAIALVSILGAFVVRLSFAREYSCDDTDEAEGLKNFICGNKDCRCHGHTARCRGNISTSVVPGLRDSITDLYLHCYDLSTLSRASFANLERLDLRRISLRQNEMGNVSADIFGKFNHLTAIDISNNNYINLTSLSIAFGSIQKMLPINLTLDKIELRNLDEKYFQYLNKSNVKYLSLKGNMIKEMNLTVLQSFTSMTTLRLSNNWINDTTGNGSLTRLLDLDLSNNHLMKNINFCTGNAHTSFFPYLETLLLGNNRIGTINDTFAMKWGCLKKLRHLDLSGNSIKVVDFSSFSNMSSLKSLILSKNWIKTVIIGKYPDSLEIIDFSKNEFAVFPPKLCENSTDTFPGIRKLNFSRNYIQKILLANWSCLPGLKSLDFSKNDVEELRNNTFNNLTKLTHLYLDNMVPWVKRIESATFNSTSLQNLSLRYNMIDFRKQQMKRLFKFCPNIKWLDISYNIFFNVSVPSIVEILLPLTKLEVLKAQRIGLRKIPAEIILHFKNLEYLDINRNLIYVIQFPEEFNNESLQLSIRYLSAAEGDIETVEKGSFPVSIRNSLKELDISDNDFACTCKMLWFRDNIKNGKIGNITLLKWPEMYKCQTPENLQNTLFQKYQPDEVCEHIKPIIVAFIAVGCSLFVFSTLFATVYWNRWYFQYYWYKLSKKRKERLSRDSEREPILPRRQYDAYVVYNSTDGPFVHHTFRSFIEGKLGYKLHIWERNAKVGALVDVILDAMYASKNVIVIVSDNLMKDQWCKFQVDVAIDRSIDFGQKCIMLVVLEDVEVKLISKAWCVLLTKIPTAHWCSCEDGGDIRRKYFEQKIKKNFGKPLSEQCVNSE